MASNGFSLVHAALLVCFERAQSPAVAAATSDALKHILAGMAAGARMPPLNCMQTLCACCRSACMSQTHNVVAMHTRPTLLNLPEPSMLYICCGTRLHARSHAQSCMMPRPCCSLQS
jgi:hypothetical protein